MALSAKLPWRRSIIHRAPEGRPSYARAQVSQLYRLLQGGQGHIQVDISMNLEVPVNDGDSLILSAEVCCDSDRRSP